MNYIFVNVLSQRDTLDCSLNGVTVTARNIVAPCEDGNITKQNAIDYGYTMLELVDKPFPTARDAFKELGETRWTMFGGNYVVSSDSRFMKQYGGPVAVHDRIEG